MQKTKRIILVCLWKNGVCDRFKIRKYFEANSRPTNSSELIRQLDALEKAGCVIDVVGHYNLTKKGEELLDLLNRVAVILK